MALSTLRVPSASRPHELIARGARVVTLITELLAPGVKFRSADLASASHVNRNLLSVTPAEPLCDAFADRDKNGERNAQIVGQHWAFIRIAACASNVSANEANAGERSSALTLKDTCAQTVNGSVTDLAGDTSGTTSADSAYHQKLAFNADDRPWLQVDRGGPTAYTVLPSSPSRLRSYQQTAIHDELSEQVWLGCQGYPDQKLH